MTYFHFLHNPQEYAEFLGVNIRNVYVFNYGINRDSVNGFALFFKIPEHLFYFLYDNFEPNNLFEEILKIQELQDEKIRVSTQIPLGTQNKFILKGLPNIKDLVFREMKDADKVYLEALLAVSF